MELNMEWRIIIMIMIKRMKMVGIMIDTADKFVFMQFWFDSYLYKNLCDEILA